MDHFLRVSFKYRENPFEYEEKTDKKTTIKSKIKPQEKDILNYCKEPRSLTEICDKFGFKDAKNFKKNYLNTLIDTGKLGMTIPNQPKNRNQRYVSK